MMLILCCSFGNGDLINAHRRAAYRNNKSDGSANQQVNGKSSRPQSLCDITNVLEDREINKPTRDYHGW